MRTPLHFKGGTEVLVLTFRDDKCIFKHSVMFYSSCLDKSKQKSNLRTFHYKWDWLDLSRLLLFPYTHGIHILTFSFSSSFPADTSNPFVEMHSDIPKIIHMTVGKEMIIPCRVTAPNIAVTLKKVLQSKHTPMVLLLMWILHFVVVVQNYCGDFQLFQLFSVL